MNDASSSRTPEEDHARLRELADTVGRDLLIRIAQAVCAARRKHPQFASCFKEGMHAVESEFYEFKAQAILGQKENGALRQNRVDKSEAELLDLIATGMRQLNREWDYRPNVNIAIQCVNNIPPAFHCGGIVGRPTGEIYPSRLGKSRW